MRLLFIETVDPEEPVSAGFIMTFLIIYLYFYLKNKDNDKKDPPKKNF